MGEKDAVHIHNRIVLSHKKDELMPPAATRVGLEMIVLSEVKSERQIPYDITYTGLPR